MMKTTTMKKVLVGGDGNVRERFEEIRFWKFPWEPYLFNYPSWSTTNSLPEPGDNVLAVTQLEDQIGTGIRAVIIKFNSPRAVRSLGQFSAHSNSWSSLVCRSPSSGLCWPTAPYLEEWVVTGEEVAAASVATII